MMNRFDALTLGQGFCFAGNRYVATGEMVLNFPGGQTCGMNCAMIDEKDDWDGPGLVGSYMRPDALVSVAD